MLMRLLFSGTITPAEIKTPISGLLLKPGALSLLHLNDG